MNAEQERVRAENLANRREDESERIRFACAFAEAILPVLRKYGATEFNDGYFSFVLSADPVALDAPTPEPKVETDPPKRGPDGLLEHEADLLYASVR